MKIFSIYDAEKGHSVQRSVKKALFKDEDELNDYIKKVRREQTVINQEFKRNRMRKVIDERMNKPIVDINSDLNISDKVINNLDNFVLDKGTGNSTVIFGSGKTGKTTLMMNTIYEKYYKPSKEFISTLFSGNKQLEIYKDKQLIVADGFNKRSEKAIKMSKYINMKTKNHYEFLWMFDDIIDMKFSKIINDMILSYRNSNLSSVICLQYIKLLNKQNRANTNNIIIFRNHTDESIKDVIDTYLKYYFVNMGLDNYKDQYNFYKQVTEDHGFIYICTKLNRISFHKINY